MGILLHWDCAYAYQYVRNRYRMLLALLPCITPAMTTFCHWMVTAPGVDYPPSWRVAGLFLRVAHTELLPLLRGIRLGAPVQADPRLA